MRVQNKTKKIKEQGQEKCIIPKTETHMPQLMQHTHDGPLDKLTHHPLTQQFILPPPLCSKEIDLKRMIGHVIFLGK